MTIILTLTALMLVGCGIIFRVDTLVFIGLMVLGMASFTLKDKI